MNRRDPVFGGKRDEDTLVAIRRAQLDIFWAQEPSTVASNFSRLRRDYLDFIMVFSLREEVLPYLPSPEVVDSIDSCYHYFGSIL